jgi:hypothetical protein
LVDVLSTMLADREHLARGVDVVWFASDYPYPVSLTADFELRSTTTTTTGDGGRAWSSAASGLGKSAASSSPFASSTTVGNSGVSLPSKPLPKSVTFRNFNEQHDTAVSILQDAFRQGGELEAWKLTDVSEAITHRLEHHSRDDPSDGLDDVGSSNDDLEELEGLVRDAGVLGIVDKLVATEATLFVSGSRKCSRQR